MRTGRTEKLARPSPKPTFLPIVADQIKSVLSLCSCDDLFLHFLSFSLSIMHQTQRSDSTMVLDSPSQDLHTEIAQLEARLQDMRAQLDASTYARPPSSHPDNKTPWSIPANTSMLHTRQEKKHK